MSIVNLLILILAPSKIELTIFFWQLWTTEKKFEPNWPAVLKQLLLSISYYSFFTPFVYIYNDIDINSKLKINNNSQYNNIIAVSRINISNKTLLK